MLLSVYRIGFSLWNILRPNHNNPLQLLPPHEIPYRAELRQPSGPFNPLTFGKIFSFGTFTLSKTSSPVALARSDHLPCVSGVVNPFIPRSRISPFISPFSSLAHTTATSANGALLIHIFEPLRITWSPLSLKLDSMPDGLEPKSGSVNPKHPIHSPVASFGKYFLRCPSLPYV